MERKYRITELINELPSKDVAPTREKICSACGFSLATLYRMERMKADFNDRTPIATLEKIAAVLKVTLDDLIPGGVDTVVENQMGVNLDQLIRLRASA